MVGALIGVEGVVVDSAEGEADEASLVAGAGVGDDGAVLERGLAMGMGIGIVEGLGRAVDC